MDIFRFTNPNDPSKMEYGQIINGAKTKMWVERYAEPGEFTITGDVSSGLREQLPIGSYISHVNSTDIMIVEDHQIRETARESTITITGRSFETFLDNRIVGANRSFPTSGEPPNFTLTEDKSWIQIRNLIRFHTLSGFVVNPDDAVPNLIIHVSASGAGDEEERAIRKGPLHQAVLALLDIDNIGIKTIRPGPWSPATDKTNTTIEIHKGVDKANTVRFTHSRNELSKADYLWSNQKEKNVAYVYGRWMDTLVSSSGTHTGLSRRILSVDATDIDDKYQTEPSGGTRTSLINQMQARGRSELAKRKRISLSNAEVLPGVNSPKYRVDYDLGDTVMVLGEYNASEKKRVVEYVEVEDETSAIEYPTLDSIGDS